jgi:hypothetical protein
MVSIESYAGRVIAAWIAVVIVGISTTVKHNKMFQIGPNAELIILEIPIDTGWKYMIILSFCAVNSCARTINSNVIHSWITNAVQDKSNTDPISPTKAYFLSSVNSAYVWFDFFMYMNILMSQIDLFMAEVIIDLLITAVLTRHYLRGKRQYSRMLSF